MISGGERLALEPGQVWFWSPLALEHVARYRFAAPRVRGLTVLEAASGTGYGAALLAKTAATVVGVDTDRAAVEFATRRWAGDAVRFQFGDVKSLPFQSVSFDAVVSFETIEHVHDPADMVAEVARVLRPGGKLILSTPNRDVYNWADHAYDHGNEYHFSEMSLPELLTLIADSFEIEAVHGQVLVPDYTPERPPPRGGSPTGRIRQTVRSTAQRVSRPILVHPRMAESAARYFRRRYDPAPIDDRPWKYLLVEARLRA